MLRIIVKNPSCSFGCICTVERSRFVSGFSCQMSALICLSSLLMRSWRGALSTCVAFPWLILKALSVITSAKSSLSSNWRGVMGTRSTADFALASPFPPLAKKSVPCMPTETARSESRAVAAKTATGSAVLQPAKPTPAGRRHCRPSSESSSQELEAASRRPRWSSSDSCSSNPSESAGGWAKKPDLSIRRDILMERLDVKTRNFARGASKLW
mmetsp:Transcript_317/g.681  ORF Transcript_317/g.681 Transcript_317/m.681 type:complete len:213 (-) Transcript_317:75-713(-)